MSDKINEPVGTPDSGTQDKNESFSPSEEVESILSGILGADGSYRDEYNSVFARYNGTPVSPAPVMRRQQVDEAALRKEEAKRSASYDENELLSNDARRAYDGQPRSRDGELSYRDRYRMIYGEPAPRRRENEAQYPSHDSYATDSRRRNSVNRLPSDVERIFEGVQREAQSPDISVNGVKYPTLGGNRSGERVIYDADWEERAQREAAEELQRRMRGAQYDYPTERRGRYESDFVMGGVPISRAGRQTPVSRDTSSLIDPITQDDSLYSSSSRSAHSVKTAGGNSRNAGAEDRKKPFFSQGFPESQVSDSGIAHGETSDYAYGEHDAVLDSFSDAYSVQTQREELWRQPLEKGDKRKKKEKNKRGKNSSEEPVRQNTVQPGSQVNPVARQNEAEPPATVRHAVFPIENTPTQDIAGSVIKPSVQKYPNTQDSTPGEPVKPDEIKIVSQENTVKSFEKKVTEKPIGEVSEEEFFGEENFDNPEQSTESDVDVSVKSETAMFDLGVFDEESSEFILPENYKTKRTFKERFKTFIYNNFPNRDDNKLNVLRKIIMDVSLVAFICAFIYLGVYFVRYREHIREGNELESIAGEYETQYSDEELEALWSDIHAQYPDVVFPEGMNIRFTKLYAVNQDVVGWLTVPGKQISTVILQTNDNSYYLNKDYFGSTSRYGNPYADYRCVLSADGLSKNTIIYGHNTHDGLVFASLLDYMEIDGYKSSPVIEFETLFEKTYWKVFGVMLTNANPSEDNGHTFEYLYASYGSDEAFMDIVNGIRQRSMIHTDIDVEPTDNMLVLYTCYNNIFKNGRLVIAARQVREGESTDVDTSTAYFNYNARYPQAYYTAMKVDNPYSDADDNIEIPVTPEPQSEQGETQTAESTTSGESESVTSDVTVTQAEQASQLQSEQPGQGQEEATAAAAG